ncbi:unnamed protein product, partial [Nesidiocoris tenuis]
MVPVRRRAPHTRRCGAPPDERRTPAAAVFPLERGPPVLRPVGVRAASAAQYCAAGRRGTAGALPFGISSTAEWPSLQLARRGGLRVRPETCCCELPAERRRSMRGVCVQLAAFDQLSNAHRSA